MRLFIGVFLASEIQAHLTHQIGSLSTLEGIRWVAPASLHLTLKFFGEVPADQLGVVQEIVRSAAVVQSPFWLTCGAGGVYPNPSHPAVFWTGIKGEGGDLLRALAQRLEALAAARGFPPESRSYSPHITIGRWGDERHAGKSHCARFVAQMAAYQTPPFHVGGCDLVRSHLSGRGAEYETIDTFAFGSARP